MLPTMPKKLLFAAVLYCFTSLQTGCAAPETTQHPDTTAPKAIKPLFKDFMGINGHVTFRPALHGQASRLVRNYHNINWDANTPGDALHIPVTVNKLNWKNDVYGPWKNAGLETDICLQFRLFGAGTPRYQQLWKGHEQWAYDYGKAMAAYYGPSGKEQLATSLEIDNEPGNRFEPALFQTLFTKMAQGIRKGDPRMKIVTPAVVAGKGDSYSQGLDNFYGDKHILPLYDIINLHTYATMEKTATNENSWHRSFPEDSSLRYLKVIDEAVSWRNQHAPGKEVWITEFGYDACTPAAMKQRKDWALKLNWQGATDLQQAQYLVRSFLAFAVRDVQRAYLYYYNDEDEASFHAASGLTRNFVPKPAFWAVRQLYQTLGEYRFRRVVKQEEGQLYVYEFEDGQHPQSLIWVAWSPTGADTQHKENYQPHTITTRLDQLPGKAIRITRMATAEGPAPAVAWEKAGDNGIRLTINESPAYIIFQKK